MPKYNVVNVSQPAVLRTGGAAGTKHHQTDMGLLWTPPAMNIRFAPNAAFTNQREGATIEAWELQNRSAGVASCGVGFRLSNRIWKAGRYDGTTYTDLTSSVQSATGTATLGVAGADQTGFAIGCLIPFDWFSVNITTAETNAGGGTVVDHAVTYSNAAGTGWTAIGANAALTDDFTADNAVLDAAVHNFVWAKPTDWGANVSITGLPTPPMYWIYVTAAEREAGDVAPIATGIEIGVGRFREAIADNGVYADDMPSLYSPYATGMIAYFSTANAGNMVSALVRQG